MPKNYNKDLETILEVSPSKKMSSHNQSLKVSPFP
jgi:hypothetical protein